MAFPDVDLACLVARQFPGWKERLRFTPPQLRWKGGWRQIRAIHPESSGVCLILEGGEAVRLDYEPADGAREEHLRDLVQYVLADNPGFRIHAVHTKTDRVRHQSAAFLRLLLKRGRRVRVVVAVGPEAPTSLRDRLLVTLVLWWDQLDLPPGLAEARLYAPTHWRGQIEPFLSYLRIPLIRLSLIPTGGYSRDSEPGGEGVGSGLMPARTILPTLATLPPILQHLQHRYPALDLQPRMGNWELSYRGFSLVWSESGGPLRIYPGRPVIDEEQADRVLERLLPQVTSDRSFPPRKRSLFYASNPERWLESRVIRNLPSLIPNWKGPIYSQVPTYIDGRRRILDLVTLDGDNRLLVLELKVEKELGVVFQALDYWRRVSNHLADGDFPTRGYFPNHKLQASPPRVVLVAPLFEFHPVFPILRKYLTKQIRFECIGVSADWRRNFRVLSRFEF